LNGKIRTKKHTQQAQHKIKFLSYIFVFGDVLSYVRKIDIAMENIRRAAKGGALVFGTVDNYFSYIKDVILYGSWKDYEYLIKHRKLPISSEFGTFEARAIEPDEIKEIFEKYCFEVTEISALACMPNVELSITD
jgi:hypothetical protein